MFKKGHPYRYKKGEHPSPETEFKKGQKPWNMGLTKETDERLKIIGEKISKANQGKVAWNKGRDWPEEIRKKMAGFKGRSHTEESKKKMGLARMGTKNSQWQGGKSFEPYGLGFNKKLKEQIKKRDNYRCQECFRHQDELYSKSGRKYKLLIHHIDFNKKNNHLNNLISLCRNCHIQTNFKRENWIKYFQRRVEQFE